jgi:hypothetical protein
MPKPAAPWESMRGNSKGGVAEVADVHQPPRVLVRRAPTELSER